MQVELFRKMSAEQKLELAAGIRRLNLELLESGIRSREGNLPPEQMRLKVLQYILPAKLFSRFYSSAP